jgi:hypothetical protein
VVLRSETKFSPTPGFKAIVDALSGRDNKEVTSHILRFERAWRNSRSDGELPFRYHFEHYKDVDGPYRLCHIRAGPNNNYRVIVMFLDGHPKAYWIYLFKKGSRESPEMKHARVLAKEFWDEVKGDKNA